MILKYLNIGKSLSSHTGRTVRNYYKPKHKEAFYDVEGVVTKDILLFRYEDPKKVFRTNMIAMSMMPLWAYLGYFSYTLKSKVESFREEVVDNTKINFLMDNVSKASRGVGLAFFLFGASLSSYWVIRTMNTVRKLVLRKGGKYLSVQTYGLTGKSGQVQNIPVVHCSGIQHTFYGKHRFFLKVRDHSFKYQFNLEDGVVTNKPLFNRTVGISRTI